MDSEKCDLGMIGLGTMGRNLVLNMAEHGFLLAGYDLDPQKIELLRREARPHIVQATASLKEFADALKKPRVMMLLVPAGAPVDSATARLLEYLEPGDILIDGGNSHFKDTEARQQALGEKGIHFIGLGISGGEAGARHGPSLMPGGPREAWDHVRPIFEAIAARSEDGEPCVAWLGPAGAGHYVKMVHNGIEYGLMQLLAETYHIMRRGLDLDDDALHEVYARWEESAVSSYLVEITADIFRKKDTLTDKPLIDMIRDTARQKGTGAWTSEEGLAMQVPTPTIDIAVEMRDLSASAEQRQTASRILRGPLDHFDGNRRILIDRLRDGYFAAMLLTYAQGLALLRAAALQHDYGIDLETVARVWRGGCIIRAALLDKIAAALRRQPNLPLIFFDPDLQQDLAHHQSDLRYVACAAGDIGIPVPAFMITLAYYDAWRSAWLPENLIQAQRDYFGAHTYERIDRAGAFHTQWAAGGKS